MNDIKAKIMIDRILQGFLKGIEEDSLNTEIEDKEKLLNNFVNNTIELEFSKINFEQFEKIHSFQKWYKKQNEYFNKLISKYGAEIQEDLFEFENAIDILAEIKMEYLFKQGVKEGLGNLKFLKPVNNFQIEINNY